MKKRTSIIWTTPVTEFQSIINNSKTLVDVLRIFGLGSGNYKSLKLRIKQDNINISHIALGLNNAKNRARISCTAKPLEEVLVVNSTYNRTNLKKRLIKLGLLLNQCSECGLGPNWCGKKLSLTIDHINGNPVDNRISNLRILCPNCHAQTETFSGKHLRTNKKCIDCNNQISNKSSRCRSCKSKLQTPKIDWPDTEILKEMVTESNMTCVARRLGVSDNAVRNRIKRH